MNNVVRRNNRVVSGAVKVWPGMGAVTKTKKIKKPKKNVREKSLLSERFFSLFYRELLLIPPDIAHSWITV